MTDRTVTFVYFPDGNVKLITDHHFARAGSPEFTYTSQFEQYDDKNNVAGLAAYTIDFTYTYNSDNTLSAMAGSLLYTAGSQAGQRFPLSAVYTYY